MEKIPKNERIVVGADLNGHVGAGKNGDKNTWADMDWGREITKDKQRWILLREWN